MSFHSFRYMRGIKSASGLISRDGKPLENDALLAKVPSIFATEAHESRSARFAPVPTVMVLDGLRKEGFDPFFAVQAKSRVEGKAEYTKHMLRLRHRSLKNSSGDSFEIVLVNANDGTAAYQMIPGFFRMVCANGLMCGDTFGETKVRHSGDAIGQVIEGAYTVLEDAPRVLDQVQTMRALTLAPREQEALAEAAHVLRFPDHYRQDEARRETAITAEQLLRPNRREDVTGDLWTTFNRVQENVIRGGLSAFGRDANNRRRKQTMRAVEGIDQNRALNRALWTLAERMAELKAA